jgi:hypothetical protein
VFRRSGIQEEGVAGTCDMEGHEMILVIGARGHMVSDWDFADSQIRKVKGSVEGTRDMRGRDMITTVGSHNVVDH